MLDQSLDLGWQLLGLLPIGELKRVSQEQLDRYYRPAHEVSEQ